LVIHTFEAFLIFLSHPGQGEIDIDKQLDSNYFGEPDDWTASLFNIGDESKYLEAPSQFSYKLVA